MSQSKCVTTFIAVGDYPRLTDRKAPPGLLVPRWTNLDWSLAATNRRSKKFQRLALKKKETKGKHSLVFGPTYSAVAQKPDFRMHLKKFSGGEEVTRLAKHISKLCGVSEFDGALLFVLMFQIII